MTEVSTAWLDRVVTARQRLDQANGDLWRLHSLLQQGDIDDHRYRDGAADILWRNGTQHRYDALRRRHTRVRDFLDGAEANGDSVGAALVALTELAGAVAETILNTEALLADVEPGDNPFEADRLEEHPAHERY